MIKHDFSELYGGILWNGYDLKLDKFDDMQTIIFIKFYFEGKI